MTWYTSLTCNYKNFTSIILYTADTYLTYSTLRNLVLLLSLCFCRKIDWASESCHVFIYDIVRCEHQYH